MHMVVKKANCLVCVWLYSRQGWDMILLVLWMTLMLSWFAQFVMASWRIPDRFVFLKEINTTWYIRYSTQYINIAEYGLYVSTIKFQAQAEDISVWNWHWNNYIMHQRFTVGSALEKMDCFFVSFKIFTFCSILFSVFDHNMAAVVSD